MWDIIKHINSCLVGIQEEEERERKYIESLFEEIIMENFLNLPSKGNRQTIPGSTESSKQDESKEAHTNTHHN